MKLKVVGNASQVSDGAAAVLLARRSVAQKLGLPILGKYVISAVIGGACYFIHGLREADIPVPPSLMGCVAA